MTGLKNDKPLIKIKLVICHFILDTILIKNTVAFVNFKLLDFKLVFLTQLSSNSKCLIG